MFKLDEIFRYSPDGDGGTPPAQEPPVVKTFVQQDVDAIVESRLAKERTKYVNEKAELLKKLGVEDETKIDDVVVKIQEHSVYKTEAETLKAELVKNTRLNELRKLNVDDDFLDYALTKVTGETNEEFLENAVKFVETNPKIRKDNFITVNSGLSLDGQGNVDLNKMTTEQYLAYRAKNKL